MDHLNTMETRSSALTSRFTVSCSHQPILMSHTHHKFNEIPMYHEPTLWRSNQPHQCVAPTPDYQNLTYVPHTH